MGGGSSVMGMVAYRGTPDDYHEWEALGATGWGWNDVLPFYRKLEHEMDFAGELHGKDGPVPIRRTKPDDWAPLSKAVHVYAQERQIPFIADMNADFRDGYGAVPMSNWPNKRASAAICYLDAPVRARRNLTIINGATATGFVFEGRRVTDVVARINGEDKQFSAREIILALGGIHSPAFLMRAGIGPAAHLRELGIDVRHDLPGVGRNLSNHAIVFVGLLQKPEARQAEELRPHPMTAFRYSSGLPGAPPCDMYINVQCKTSWSALGRQVANLAPTLLKPKARGRVTLTGPDARPPRVEFNFTGHELDLHRFMQGFRRAVEILAHENVREMSGVTFPVKFDDRLRRLNRISTRNKVQSALVATLIDLVPSLAGPVFSVLADRRVDLQTLIKDDDALAEHIRQNVAGTFHPVGTCRMGAPNYREAVTDTAGHVLRHRRPARGRRLDHADGAPRQHQHPDHHAGREDFRRHRRVAMSGGVVEVDKVPRDRCAPSPRWGEGRGEVVRGLLRELNPSPHPSPTQVGPARLAQVLRRDPGKPGARGRGSRPSLPFIRRLDR